MKIVITSQGKTLKDDLDSRFGRCQYFLIVDDETNEVEAIPNPQLSAGGGAGIQTAQFMVDRGIKAVLTGNIGPNASKVLNEAGIKIYIHNSGTGESVLNDFKNGKLTPTTQANVSSHFGLK